MEFEKVRDVIVETLGCEAGQVTEQATLEELGADSLAAVELIMALEGNCHDQPGDLRFDCLL